MPERRSATRVGLLGRPTARARDRLEVWLVDLSRTGARITLGELLPQGSACPLTLPPWLGSLTLPARVIWSATFGGEQTPESERHFRYQSGLAFAELPEEERATLASVLADLSAAAGLEAAHQAP
ncbi:MAG: PilZ domain-containing protein [Candidatus Methylomirabilales bacterium]